MEILNDIEAACVIFALYEEHELKKKEKNKVKRRHWVHPLNLKRPENGQFQVTFMTLRSYPEEFFKYYRMSITSFDELISLIGPKLSKQQTGLRVPISPEERLTVTLR
ncbi:protein ANTAGONIST OF LIKE HETEROCHROMATIN PROTEIN 1-like [Aphis craccivora]|uniref:Protein ANTAGONIST OF LIKE HETEROCHROMATIN PROTEIN 1-like n=1 Tax=Aphis craccivora TaxID=307492 RepID=A0A6G0ZNT0_APHCR|nr:protein ANTAGONIST OF LIKE HETEROCHROMATIN PROTEIN 1-like [Aphis craccivora]